MVLNQSISGNAVEQQSGGLLGRMFRRKGG